MALTVLVDGPSHGHGVWTRLASCAVEDWAAVSRAQVYYSLGKLAEQGLIRPAPGANRETRRERRSWRITADGRRALTTALASKHWASQRAVPPFVTWVALSNLARPAARRQVLGERRVFLERELARERETLAEVSKLSMDDRVALLTHSMVQQAIRQIRLELDWLDELADVLAN